MEKHVCYKPDDLTDLVDALHPVAFRVLPAKEFDKEKARAALERTADTSADPETFDLLRAAYELERRTNQELAQYGSARPEIVDNLGLEIARCDNCSANYGKFLDGQVIDSQTGESGRDPYNTREDADRDFLNLGPIVKEI